jgi:hypothetical protein
MRISDLFSRLSEWLEGHGAIRCQTHVAFASVATERSKGEPSILIRALVEAVGIPRGHDPAWELELNNSSILPLNGWIQRPKAGPYALRLAKEVSEDVDEVYACFKDQESGHGSEEGLAVQIGPFPMAVPSAGRYGEAKDIAQDVYEGKAEESEGAQRGCNNWLNSRYLGR